MLKKTGLAISLLMVVLGFSCQQEIAEIINSVSSCRIDKGYYYGGSGGINDSVLFTYSDNKVIKAEGVDDIVNYTYTGNHITGRRFYEKPGNLFWSVDSILYDGSGNITKMINRSYPSSQVFDTTLSTYDFSYTAGRLSQVIETETIVNNPPDSILYTIHTDASGNLDKITFSDFGFNYQDSVLYAFDTNPNYFKIVHPHFFLFDPFFELQVGLVSQLPYFYSHNNVINFNVYGAYNNPVVYGVDSANHVTRVDMGGFEYMKYRYSCQ
jgi:hypothetical protein